MQDLDSLKPNQLRSLQEFEKLHNQYLASPNKEDLLIKKVYAIETYALYAKENYVIMATIAHNRTEKTVGEVLESLYEDAKIDEESNFILKWF